MLHDEPIIVVLSRQRTGKDGKLATEFFSKPGLQRGAQQEASLEGNVKILKPRIAREQWLTGVQGIAECGVSCSPSSQVLHQSIQCIQMVWEWIDRFNSLYKSMNNSRDNPEFACFMKDVSILVCSLLDGTQTGAEWPGRFLCATVLLRCLFQRWPHVKQARGMAGIFRRTTFSSLEQCRSKYGEALVACKGQLDEMVGQLGGDSQRLLLQQLEALLGEIGCNN